MKCFGVNRLLSQKATGGMTKVVLTMHSHHPCEKIEHELTNFYDQTQIIKTQENISLKNENFIKKYIIKVKTGNEMLSETTNNVLIRLYDEQNQQSEDIQLVQTVNNTIPFRKQTIDEFQAESSKNLSNLRKIHLWYPNEKHQKWLIEWIQIEDINLHRLYCFPVVSLTKFRKPF